MIGYMAVYSHAMTEAQVLCALQMIMVVVVDEVVDLVAAVVAEEILEVEEVVAEEEGVLPAGLVTGPAPAAATTALPASTQLPVLPDPLHSLQHIAITS